MAPIAPPPEYIPSFDGCRLATYEMGTAEGPVLFLINGLGGNLNAWRFIIEHFQDRFRIVSYDYRGMYNSKTPPERDFSMDAHVHDAMAVLDHYAVERAVVMGWSMGVQIALEVMRIAPDRALALVLSNGAYGRPLDQAMPKLKPLAALSMDLLARYGPKVRKIARPLAGTVAPLKVAKVVGFVSKHLDEEVFLDLVHEFIELDFENYRDCVATLVEHDAEDVLEHIQVPTLILGGDRDLFTPGAFSRKMAQLIPDATLHIIKDASHYCAVEYPGIIISHMERFFLERLDL